MKLLKPVLLLSGMAAMLFQGCSLEPYTEPASETYTKSFIKNFGVIDPRQDWNLVAQLARQNRGRASRAMTVVSPETSPVTVSQETLSGENGYMILSKQDVFSYQEVLPESQKSGVKLSETNLNRPGITKDFFVNVTEIWLFPEFWHTGSRTKNEIGIYYYVDSSVEGAESVTTTGNEEKWIVHVPIFKGALETLEAIKDNANWGLLNIVNDGYSVLENNWAELEAKYPQKFHTTASGEKGLTSENGKTYTETTFYKTDYYVITGKDDDTGLTKYMHAYTFQTQRDEFICEMIGTEMVGFNDQKFKIEGGKLMYDSSKERYTYAVVDQDYIENVFNDEKVTGLRSWGTHISFDRQVSVGFYIKNGESNPYFYSEAELNPKKKFAKEEGAEAEPEEIETSYICTYVDPSSPTDTDGNPKRRLCFEDWPNDNFDLNDLVFRAYGFDDTTIVDKETVTDESVVEEGLLVCEDLGALDDIDFNDVVLKLRHLRTVKTTTEGETSTKETSDRFVIIPMAAGGTLKSTVYYKGEELGEIHNLLGGSAPNVINALNSVATRFGEEFVYDLTSDDWDDEADGGKYDGYVSKVFGEKLINIRTLRGKEMDSEVLIEAPGIGEAPQMMLLPHYWWWPQERNSIEEVYPGFMDWVKDFKNNQWINNHEGGTRMHVKHCDHPEDLGCCKQ